VAPSVTPRGSSTSRPRPSPASPLSAQAYSTSASPGSEPPAGRPTPPIALGRRALRELAARHGIRPSKSLGQNFLIDPNLGRAIAADSGIGAADRVVEVGAGLGSLTLALAATGAHVLALEFDRRIWPALQEVTAGLENVEAIVADALSVDWRGLADEPFAVCGNLPYNIAVPIVSRVLEDAPLARRLCVMVQRELGERICAMPRDEAYGALSLRIAYRARAEIVRNVPPSVFWPEPKVGSALVRIERLDEPPVTAPPEALLPLIEVAFSERRKTMQNALRRNGSQARRAAEILVSCDIDPRARPEELSLQDFSGIAEALARDV
jgi:16S rRNA (adenine1518-N6/adenine1519-N6)-dimethyltransferase